MPEKEYKPGYEGVIEYIRDHSNPELSQETESSGVDSPISIAYTPASFISASKELIEEEEKSFSCSKK